MLTRVCALLAALTAASACGDDEDACALRPGDGISLGFQGTGKTPRCIHGTVHARRDGVWTTAGVALDSDLELTFWIVADAPVEALAIQLEDVPADRMLQQGWQSWSWVGSVEIPPAVTLDDDGFPAMPVPDTGDPLDEEQGVSYHSAVIRGGPEPTDGVLSIAALRAEHAATGIAVVGDGEIADVTIVWNPQRTTIDGVDGEVRSDPIYFTHTSTPEGAMDDLARKLAAEHEPDALAPRRPPAGWFTWNERFADIDEAYVTAHLDVVEAELSPLGMPLVEIDDGWEVAWGDWTANAQFPSGMPALADAITSRGLVAGIWMAPFLVDVDAQAAQGDPARFVRGPDGEPLVHRLTGITRDFYVVDTTNPDGIALAAAPLAALAAAGYTYFKLDFLYAAAFSGTRAEDVTGVEALRLGLAALRDAVGPDAVIEACGAPILPVIGRADVLRFGADTAFDGFGLDFTLVGWMARSLAGRSYLWPQIWLDADQAQVRAPYTEAEARASAALTALAGPAYSLGDDLTTLPADRLAIALEAQVRAIAGHDRPPRALGIMDAASPEVVGSPILEAFRAPAGVLVPAATSFELEDGTIVEDDWNATHDVEIR